MTGSNINPTFGISGETPGKLNINAEIREIDKQLAALPDGYLVYKTIKNKPQPYLQWHEDGKTKSRYLKLDERETILMQIELRADLLREKERLLAYQKKLMESWKNYPGLGVQSRMTGQVGIGVQYFAEVMEKHLFYVDKSMFIKEWWESGSKVELVTRPRRFGKSLNLDMLDCFFSMRYKNRVDLFENLQIWQCSSYRPLQGSRPVIHLDLSGVKAVDYKGMLYMMTQMTLEQYRIAARIYDIENDFQYVSMMNSLNRQSGDYDILPAVIAEALYQLCEMISAGTGRKVIILMDEYDTPMTEIWSREANSSEEKRRSFELMRLVFHSLLKDNPYLEKALLTGITRISRESLFSDLNHVLTSTVTDDRYTGYFGFTEEEVFASLDSQNFSEHEKIKAWYDGFTIGSRTDIYNPWSITNYLQTGIFDTYWINTSSNTMIGDLIRRSSASVKKNMETLLRGEHIMVTVQEDIVFDELYHEADRIWGLLLAAGYLTGKCLNREDHLYELRITNQEVMLMFERLFRRWFSGYCSDDFEDFKHAMLSGDTAAMKDNLQEIMLETFSYFDTGTGSEMKKAENFYHGFMLGLSASLHRKYLVTSNRESGRGRYDIMITPRQDPDSIPSANSVILEFKVCREESKLHDTAKEALAQILQKDYAAELRRRAIPDEKILQYGIAFCGKNVEIIGLSGTGAVVRS